MKTIYSFYQFLFACQALTSKLFLPPRDNKVQCLDKGFT